MFTVWVKHASRWRHVTSLLEYGQALARQRSSQLIDAVLRGTSPLFDTMCCIMPLQVEGFIGATYDDFLAVVAKGRSMTKDAVREVAKGRVWTGSQAMEVCGACVLGV